MTMTPLTPQESQGLQWAVKENAVAVSGDADVIAKVSKQLTILGITPSLTEKKTIVISRQDLDKLERSNSGISISEDPRSKLVTSMHRSTRISCTREMLLKEVNDIPLLQRDIQTDRMFINYRDEYSDTPLHVAALCNNLEAINLLIAAKANVNTTDSQDETPLYCAVKLKADAKVIDALLDAGANPHWAYYMAVKNNNQTAMKALEAHATKNGALTMAVRVHDMEVINALIAEGGDHDWAYYIAVAENEQIPRDALRAGANIERVLSIAANNRNINALQPLLDEAVQHGDIEMINKLVAGGVTVKIESLLHLVSSGTLSTLDALVKAGASPSYNREELDRADLLWRAFRDNPTMVDPLIKAGWANLEVLLVQLVEREMEGLTFLPISDVLAKGPDMDTAIKYVEKQGYPKDTTDSIVARIKSLYGK